jgi:radical SAM-linked protein
MSQAATVRVRLGKGEEIRFVSHLGFMRAFERTVRRARIPVAYSGGYHPHPKISFATALGVGMTSEAEYLDMELNTADLGDLSTQHVFERLRSAAPPGMPVIAVCAAEGKPALASRIEWASYCVSVHASIRPELEDAVLEFLSSDSAIAEVNTKSGRRRAEIRPMVRELCWSSSGALECTLACGGRAHLRPQDLMGHLDAMRGRTGAPVEGHEFTGRSCIHRTGLYFTDREGGDLVSPMSVECKDWVMAGS